MFRINALTSITVPFVNTSANSLWIVVHTQRLVPFLVCNSVSLTIRRLFGHRLSITVFRDSSQTRAIKLQDDVSNRPQPTFVRVLRISRGCSMSGSRDRMSRSLRTLGERAIAPWWELVSFRPFPKDATIVDAAHVLVCRYVSVAVSRSRLSISLWFPCIARIFYRVFFFFFFLTILLTLCSQLEVRSNNPEFRKLEEHPRLHAFGASFELKERIRRFYLRTFCTEQFGILQVRARLFSQSGLKYI